VRRGALLAAIAALGLAVTRGAAAQSDPRLLDAVRSAQDGQSDSARAALGRLLAATATTDSLYPQILYSLGIVAADVNEREHNLQRVAVEYPISPWADDALLLLAQSDYAGGNLPGTVRDLERIRKDFPASPILPKAAVWAARTYFDMGNQRAACSWLAAGLHARSDLETRNQLRFQAQRCGALIAAADTLPPPDTVVVAAASPATKAAPDTVSHDTVSSAVANAALKPAADTLARPAPRTLPPVRDTTPIKRIDTVQVNFPPAIARVVPSGRFRIQLAAAGSRTEAEGIVRGLHARGIESDITEVGGYFKVRTGHFPTSRAAQGEATRLRAKLGNGAFVVSE
jgi:SPOR domain